MYTWNNILQHDVQILKLMHECVLCVAVILEQKTLVLLVMINV
jgi:hypothetical protein